jgi:hypothetical protein
VDGSEDAIKTQGRSIEAGGSACQTLSDRAVDSSVQRAQHDRDALTSGSVLLGLFAAKRIFWNIGIPTKKEPPGRSPDGSFPQLPARETGSIAMISARL